MWSIMLHMWIFYIARKWPVSTYIPNSRSKNPFLKSFNTKIQYFVEYLLIYCVKYCIFAGSRIRWRMLSTPLWNLSGSFAQRLPIDSIVSTPRIPWLLTSLQIQFQVLFFKFTSGYRYLVSTRSTSKLEKKVFCTKFMYGGWGAYTGRVATRVHLN